MLEGRTYVPLVHARLAEMRALRELPTPTKNLIFPVVRIRPWLNARSLGNVFEVITDSIGDRAFGLDLDETRNLPDKDRQSYREFVALFNPNGAFEAYYNCVAEAPNRVPVLRRAGGITAELDRQIDRALKMERGLVVRIESERAGDYIAVAQRCDALQAENVVFIFDCGWRQDILGEAARCTSLVDNLLDVSEEFEIVIAGSSFPDSFANLGPKFDFPVDERLLFQEVRRNINRGQITYGDWGSTRLPTNPVPMTNVPRIDIAHRIDWTSWRSEDGEDYEAVAGRVVADSDFDGDPNLWGNYMIVSTANGLDPAIRAPAMAAAVRVNLHMNAQAYFDAADGAVIEDEPVGEDL